MGWEGWHGRKLSRIPAALFPNPCPPQVSLSCQCSAESWHSFCPYQPPAKCVPRVSLFCLCVPAGDYRITELQALGRPWCTTRMEEMWLGISGTIAPLCLGELWWELRRQHGLGHMGRLCPKAAWLSLQPREAAGVPRATSHSCANSQDLSQLLDWTWQFGTERLPRPLPGLSLLYKRHHFRIQEVCK